MKQLLFVISFLGLILAASRSCQAQYYRDALGIRVGTSFELGYKHFFTDWPFQQAIEGLIGFQLDEGFQILKRKNLKQNGFVGEVLYVAHLDIGFDSRFAAYAGLGAYMGVFFESGRNPYFGGGGVGQLGIEYNFVNVPINIAIDWNPIFGYPRSSPARGAVTVRYLFRQGWR